jgi:hypothetical protein
MEADESIHKRVCALLSCIEASEAVDVPQVGVAETIQHLRAIQ